MSNANPKFPPAVPRLTSLKNAFKFVQNPIPILNQYLAEYGDHYSFNLGGSAQKGIVSIDPHLIQHVLQKNHRKYRKSEIQTKQLKHFVGSGLLTSEGAYWLKQRRLIQPGFHKNKLAALVDIMNEEIEAYCENIDQLAHTNEIFDINHNMMEMAFRIVAKSLFGANVGEEELQLLGHNITTLQSFIIKLIRQPYLNWWYNLSGQMKKHLKLGEASKSVILKYIKDRRQDSGEYDDLLDMLLSARYEDTGEGMTDLQLLDESLILFVAGHETSANALSWTWYILSQRRDVVEKIRAELDDVIGDGKISFEKLPQLDYLRCVINESMRIYPPAWITDRVAMEDDEIDGMFIPKGTMMVLYIYGVHHSKNIWEQAEEFIPERFKKENIKGRPSFAYCPFGGGPRLCIGNSFAMMEMQLIIAKLIQRYDFELIKDQEVAMQPMITLRPKNGIKMRCKKR